MPNLSLLLLSTGVCAIIEAIQVEKLEVPETTYNFEVEDYHTYYVTESKVLVHNVCVAKEGNLRADVRKGGDPNHPVGHAHIWEAGKEVASVYADGSIAAGQLSSKAQKFVTKYLKKISEGIEKFYYL